MRSMTARVLVLLATICPLASTGSAQSRGPIIDVHMHAFDMTWVRFVASIDSSWWPRAIPHPTDSDSLRIQSIRALRNNGIVRAIASGTALQTVARYQAEDPQRIIPALMFGRDMNVDSLRAAYRSGTIQSLGEVIWQYEGLSPADTSLERFWALAEELDAPIGLHMGLGPPDWPRHGPYRISLSDPLQLEDVLARHPHLRLWVMHAGWPLLDRIVGLLYAYQNVYVDVSAACSRLAGDLPGRSIDVGVRVGRVFGDEDSSNPGHHMGRWNARRFTVHRVVSRRFLAPRPAPLAVTSTDDALQAMIRRNDCPSGITARDL